MDKKELLKQAIIGTMLGGLGLGIEIDESLITKDQLESLKQAKTYPEFIETMKQLEDQIEQKGQEKEEPEKDVKQTEEQLDMFSSINQRVNNKPTLDYYENKQFNLFEVCNILSKNDTLTAFNKEGMEFEYHKTHGLKLVGNDMMLRITNMLLNSMFTVREKSSPHNLYHLDADDIVYDVLEGNFTSAVAVKDNKEMIVSLDMIKAMPIDQIRLYDWYVKDYE